MPLSSTCLQHTRCRNTLTRQPSGKTSACKTDCFIRKVSCKHGGTTNRSQSSLHCPDKVSPFRVSNAFLKSASVENADHQTHKRSCFTWKEENAALFVCFGFFLLFFFTSDSTAPTSAEATERRAGRRAFMDAARPCRQLGHTGRWSSAAAAAAAADQCVSEAETRRSRADHRAVTYQALIGRHQWPPPAFNLFVAPGPRSLFDKTDEGSLWSKHLFFFFFKCQDDVMGLQEKRWQTQKSQKCGWKSWLATSPEMLFQWHINISTALFKLQFSSKQQV